jgi:amino acid adenylation domain-containing protein
MPATHAKFDLMITLRETGDGATGTIEYATDLFTEDTVTRIGRHLVAVLEQFAALPDRPVHQLELLSEKEIELVTRWADGGPAAAGGESIPARVRAVAAARPSAPALLAASDESVSFGELEAWSNQLAHVLSARGIGTGARIGVCLERTPATLVLLLAILKAGAAYVPLDPAYPVPRLRFMLGDAGVDLVVVEDGHRDRLGEISSDHVTLTELWRARTGLPTTSLDRVHSPAQPAYLLYTSGSTGTPKGVVGLHGGMANRLGWMWREFPFEPGEVACQKTSLNFLDSFWEVFGPLGQGVPVVVVPQPVLNDPRQLVDLLAARRVSRIVLVPSLLLALLDTVPDLATRLPALRFWVSSGEPLTVDLAERFLDLLPGRALLNLYGASEVSADVTAHLVTRSDVDDRVVPLGRPIAGTAVHVLDTWLRPVPPGTVGELYVGGAALAQGYAGRPDLTAERFLPDPFRPGGLLYRTGDLGRYRADGTVEYAGRRDHQVKVRGFRVEPAEVERALVEHTDVARAVVRAENDALVAYCVAEPGAAPGCVPCCRRSWCPPSSSRWPSCPAHPAARSTAPPCAGPGSVPSRQASRPPLGTRTRPRCTACCARSSTPTARSVCTTTSGRSADIRCWPPGSSPASGTSSARPSRWSGSSATRPSPGWSPRCAPPPMTPWSPRAPARSRTRRRTRGGGR